MKTKYQNVYRNNDGQYFYQIFLGIDPTTGKRVQQKRSRNSKGNPFENAKETYLEAIKVKQEYSIKNGKSDYELPLSFFIENEYKPYYKELVQSDTYDSRISALDCIAKHFGKMKLIDIATPDCEHFRLGLLQNEDYSQNYAGLIYGVFRQTLDYAVTLGYIKFNVSKKTKAIPKEKARVKYWNIDQFEKVLSTIYVEDYYQHMCFVMLWLYYMTGVRVSEGLALRWTDVDFNNRNLRVYQTLKMKNQRNIKIQDHTKTEAGMRVISLDEDTIKYLKEWKKTQSEHGVDSFIMSTNGFPLYRSTVHRIIERYAKAAKVPVIQAKALRHSHVSYLINVVHANILVIYKRLGHSSPEITLKYYAHLFPNGDDVITDEMKGTVKFKPAKVSEVPQFNGNQAFKRDKK